MEEALNSDLWQQVMALLRQGLVWSQGLTLPGWRLYQVMIILALVVTAFLLRKLVEGRLNDWLRSREGWPKARLRFFLQLQQRLGLIFFSLLAGILYGVMQEVTWPSRSYLIGLAATLSTAWVAIGLGARLVRNQFLRRVVSWALWIYVTLHYLGLNQPVAAFLDSVAFSVGEIRISALLVIRALALGAILFTLARLVSNAASRNIEGNNDISPSMQVLAIKGVQVASYAAAFFFGLSALGFELKGLAFLSGAIGLGLGFGLQKVVSNLVSGIIILLDKSIKPGDVISLGDTFGWIDSLGARYVSVVTRDGKEYLIPNEDLITGQVVNWSHSDQFVRLDLYFGTAYQDDPHLVRKVAVESTLRVKRVLQDRVPVCHIVGFGDSSVDYILRFWITDPTGGLTNIRGNVYLALWDAFKENGISIPFPQREVRVIEGSRLETVQAAGRTTATALD